MKDIAIFGAGGFGREVACLINSINQIKPTWNLIGFFDDTKPKGVSNEYGKILGNITDLINYQNPLSVVIAIGSQNALMEISQKITNKNIDFPNIISPETIFLDKSRIKMGKGNIICARCLLSCNIIIGDFNIFNGYIPIGHDTIIGSFNTIMPSVNISGNVNIGDNNFLGVSSVILQQIKIGNNVRIGAGSVIIKKTKDNTLYVGNPAVKMDF